MQQKGMLPESCPSPNHSKSASKLTLPSGFVWFCFLYVRSILGLCFKIHAAQSQLLFETYNKPLMWFSSRRAFWHSTCLFMIIRRRRRRRNNGKSSFAWKTSRQQDHAFFFNQVLYEKQLQYLLFLKLPEPNFNTALEHEIYTSS